MRLTEWEGQDAEGEWQIQGLLQVMKALGWGFWQPKIIASPKGIQRSEAWAAPKTHCWCSSWVQPTFPCSLTRGGRYFMRPWVCYLCLPSVGSWHLSSPVPGLSALEVCSLRHDLGLRSLQKNNRWTTIRLIRNKWDEVFASCVSRGQWGSGAFWVCVPESPKVSCLKKARMKQIHAFLGHSISKQPPLLQTREKTKRDTSWLELEANPWEKTL